MKALILPFLLACVFSACAHSPASSSGATGPRLRVPSSFGSLAASASLQEVMASTDPRAESRAFVDRLLRIHLRAHGWMGELDRHFQSAKRPVRLFGQASYRKLLLSRSLAEWMEHKVASFYRSSRLLSLTAGASPAERESADRALLIVAGIRDALLEARKDPAARLLLNDLVETMKAEIGDRASIVTVELPLEPLTGEALSLAAADATPRIQQLLSELPPGDEVTEKLEGLEKKISGESSGRDPNALRVFPSQGAAGNIDGFTFPAGTWSLTFDDGPHESYTDAHLATLKALGVKASFFWLAKNVASYPEIVQRAKAAGMSLENHSYSHARLDDEDDLERLKTDLDREIRRSTELETQAYGQKPRFFRCPYGAGFNDPDIRGRIAKLGMVHVRWNVDSLDWRDKNPASVLARVERQMKVNGRGIVLFHDIQPATVGAVRRLLEKTKSRLRWLSIPEIVDEMNGVRR